jgi:hypothetical protein
MEVKILELIGQQNGLSQSLITGCLRIARTIDVCRFNVTKAGLFFRMDAA